MKKIALVGAGRMGSAILRGWAERKLELNVTVIEPTPGPELTALIEEAGWALNPDPLLTGPVELVLVAVKPQSFRTVCEETIALLCTPATLMVSIMAGTSIETLREATGAERVVRAMPNTPGQIGRGVTAVVAASEATDEDRAFVAAILEPLGPVVQLRTERELDVATAVSGSGPAYVFLLAESLIAAAEAAGLDSDAARTLGLQTVVGAAALLDHTGEDPVALRREVTSPGGTTAAALDVLTGGGGLPLLMRTAVEAAIDRARQLSRA